VKKEAVALEKGVLAVKGIQNAHIAKECVTTKKDCYSLHGFPNKATIISKS